MNLNVQKFNILSSIAFRAIQNNISKLDSIDDLTINDLTVLDDKIMIGRVPGRAEKLRQKLFAPPIYITDYEALVRDIEFLNRMGADTIIDLRDPYFEEENCDINEREAYKANQNQS